MRLRIVMLIVVCVALDVLVVRQVRKYDEQKVAHAYEQSLHDHEAPIVSHKETKSGQAQPAHVRESSAAA